jgi:hypothetical protein
MKKKATKKASARGKKSNLKDLAPKADPKAGLNFTADGSVRKIVVPAEGDVFSKITY